MKYVYIKDLKQPYREMALIEQEVQGNKRNDEQPLSFAFNWVDSILGLFFWASVHLGEHPEITPEIKAKFPSVFKDELTLSHNENSNVFEPTNRLKYKKHKQFFPTEVLTKLVLMQLWRCKTTGEEEWREIEIEEYNPKTK